MAKKLKVIPEQVKMSKDELIGLLEDAHEMGFHAGRHAQELYENEQEEDCEYMLNDHFDICNN